MFLSYSVFSWEKHCIFIFTTVLNDFNDLIFHSLSLYVICSIDLQLFYVFATINNYVIYILVCMFLGTEVWVLLERILGIGMLNLCKVIVTDVAIFHFKKQLQQVTQTEPQCKLLHLPAN